MSLIKILALLVSLAVADFLQPRELVGRFTHYNYKLLADPKTTRHCAYRVSESANFDPMNIWKWNETPMKFHSGDNVERINQMLRLMTPYDVLDYCKFRIGQIHDGGYVMLDHPGLQDIEVMYTIGVNDDTYFEQHMSLLYPNIKTFYLYDHTISSCPCENDKMRWQKRGIQEVDNPSRNLYTLRTFVNENKDWGKHKILKMDCEGPEWPVLDQMEDDLFLEWDFIILEMHWIMAKFDERFDMQMRVFERLQENYVCFHIHANNNIAAKTVEGFAFPPVIETTYIRKDLIEDWSRVQISLEDYPTPNLDFTNTAAAARPDVNMQLYPMWN